MTNKNQHAARASEIIDKALGARIRQRRVMIGMSQTHLANEIGVTFQQVQKYESGANRITVSRLIKIADAFKVEASSIIDGLYASELTASRYDQPFHNTTRALKMSRAMQDLDPSTQSAILDLAISLSKSAQPKTKTPN